MLFLKAVIILFFCIGVAAVLIKVINRDEEVMPFVIAWAVMIAILFFIQNQIIVMGYLIVLKMIYLKNDPVRNIAFFLSLFAAMPMSIQFPLIPGVNLFDVNLIQMLTIIFLVPVMVKILTSPDFELKKPDFAVILFVGILMASKFRETSLFEFTYFQVVRDIAVVLFTVVIPYFVISRGIRSFEQLDKVLVGLLFGGFAMAAFAYFEAVLVWRPYVDLGTRIGTMNVLESMYDVRGGILRVTGTMTGPISFGFYLTMIMGATFYFLKKNNVAKPLGLLYALFLLIPIFLTGSRAALLGGLVFVAMYFLFTLSKGARRLLMVPLIIVAFTGALLQGGSNPGGEAHVEEVDQYGTFDYRAKLFETSIQVIPDNLWFGTREYRNDERMQTLIQGQNIIDMVNGFIHITIEFGLIALLVFLFILVRAYRTLRARIDAGGERIIGLGHDPNTDAVVSIRKGEYGYYAQIGLNGEATAPRVALLEGDIDDPDDVSLEEALSLFESPSEPGSSRVINKFGLTPEGEEICLRLEGHEPRIIFGHDSILLEDQDPFVLTRPAVLALIDAADERGVPVAAEPRWTDDPGTESDGDLSESYRERMLVSARDASIFSQAFSALLVSMIFQFAFTSYSGPIVPILWFVLALIRAIQLIFYTEKENEDESTTEATTAYA